MLRYCSLFLGLIPWFVRAQPISFGVTGGIPISPHSQSYDQGCLGNPPLFCGPNSLLFRPYTIGPTIEVHSPWRFSVEASALYQRFHKDITVGWRIRPRTTLGHRESVSADGWLIPLLLKYTFPTRRVAPFIKAGATLRHLGSFDGKGFQLDSQFLPMPESSFHISSGRDLDVAITAGAGLRWRLAHFDFSPELRFLHWTALYYQPVQNQGMLMLTVTFPAVRR